MSRFRSLALLASLSLALACDDPVSTRPTGKYTALVSGGFNRSLDGAASMVIGRSGYGRPTFSLELGAEGAKDRISLVIALDEPPAAGDYEITTFSSEPVDEKWIAAYLLSEDDQTAGTFTSLGGLVRITRSSPDRLQGLFALDAEGRLEGSETEPVLIVIEGSFDAALASR